MESNLNKLLKYKIDTLPFGIGGRVILSFTKFIMSLYPSEILRTVNKYKLFF